jgi:hypothetical protein
VLTESVVLAGAGAMLGMLVALWGSRLLVRQISTHASPIYLDVSVDVRVLTFTIGVTAIAALLLRHRPPRFARSAWSRPLAEGQFNPGMSQRARLGLPVSSS